MEGGGGEESARRKRGRGGGVWGVRGGVACEWVRGVYLEGQSQAYGMIEQATQPQESPPQQPQRPPHTGGSASPTPPASNCRHPWASHPLQGLKIHQGVKGVHPEYPTNLGSGPGSVPDRSKKNVQPQKFGEKVMSTGPLSHESKLDPNTPHLPHLRYIPPAPIQLVPSLQHLRIRKLYSATACASHPHCAGHATRAPPS